MASLVDVDVSDLRAKLGELSRQLPYASSRAINDVAFDARKGGQKHIERRLTIRRKWVLRQLKVIKSSKRQDPVTGWVYTDSPLIAEHETGTVRTPRGKALTIPTQAVRPNKRRSVPKSKRPRRILRKPNVFISRGVIWKRTGPKKRRKMTALYILRPKAVIPRRLTLVDMITKLASKTLPRALGRRIREAIETAKRGPRR